MTSEEISDMFLMVQKVQCVMEKIHQASSSSIVVQDGKDAGQTIKHVHVHILPRKPKDFLHNDYIYAELQKQNQEDINWRSEEEMAKEAHLIKEYL
uniref:bis(5'-adenosyl)-triphosphatase n=1 Tax=Timema poppense TaxID=170557 RepID=A0A7R9DK03_TIMPO|nr:unnamed protein product [Timema poppensis]